MTIVLALLAVLLVVVAIAAALLHHHRDTSSVDPFNKAALQRVVERHEKENVGRE
jgi:hypothetical protein